MSTRIRKTLTYIEAACWMGALGAASVVGSFPLIATIAVLAYGRGFVGVWRTF